MTAAVARSDQVNAKGIRAVLEAISARPQMWSQDAFMATSECGTVYCMAGWTCLLAGLDVAATLRQPNGPVKVFDLAQRLLGLQDYQADQLFLYGIATNGEQEHPTVDEFVAHVAKVTGVTL